MRRLIYSATIGLCGLLAPATARAVSYDSGAGGTATMYVSSTALAAPAAASTQFGNVAQISLTPGDWDVSGIVVIIANGGTVTVSQGAISVNTGNTTTDHVLGDNLGDSFLATSAINGTVSLPSYRLSVAATTVVYLKAAVTFAVATPNVRGRISARKM